MEMKLYEKYLKINTETGKLCVRIERLEREKWTRLADMIEGRRYISNSCLEWKGSIWVFGGWQSKRVERYDLNTKKWIKMA